MPDDKNIANEYLELHRRLLEQLAKATAVKESMERMEQEIEAQIHKVQASYGNYLAQKVLYGGSSNG